MNERVAMLAGLIEKSMNLGPEWTVSDVEFREGLPTGDELHIFIERAPGSAVECPSCHCRCGVYDARPGEWRHLDIWQYKTIIHCDVPRADCPECGVKTSRVPWASEDAARFTALFEAHALLMVMSGMPVSGAAKVLRLNDTVLWRMLNRLAERARAQVSFEGVTRVGVDETARRRGHNYLTAFVDLDVQRAMFCCEGRDASAVAAFAADLEAHGGKASAVETVTCDLSPAFASGVAEHLPKAKRVADRFHVMQIANRQLDLVRAGEARESEEKRRLLKRTKYVWLKREENLTARQLETKRSLAAENLKTGRACAMVEALRRAYDTCETAEEAKAELDALTSWIMHSNVPQMKKLARTLRDNEAEVLAYFKERATNAILEGMNSVIQAAKRAARGFRNTEYFKTVIYLKLGKLPLVDAVCATH